MGNNIELWKTKKLDGLTFPLMAVQEVDDALRDDWKIDGPHISLSDNCVRISIDITEDGYIKGELNDGRVTVEEIKLRGECSGTYYHDFLLPLLRKSTGHLEAATIWESNDIFRLTASDGVITEEDIEL